MLRVLVRKFSSLLLKAHRFLDRYGRKKNQVEPYRLNYQPSPGKTGIVHFNGNFVIGGTSQLIADIVERTSDKYSHHIIVPSHPDPLPYQPVSLSAYPLQKLPELYKYLRDNRPALVHIHYWVRPMHRYYDFGIWYNAVFRICEELQLKVIQNINVPTRPFESSSVCHNVFVSHYVKDEFDDQPLVSSSVIYPGSDLAHFRSPDSDLVPDDAIGMVYRLDPDKLNPEAIEVFIEAARQKKGLRCYIIGDGRYLDHYKKRVREEKLQEQFIFTGYISYRNLPGYYKKLALVVAPVHDESFGQVTPFAMGMGLPVTGYDTGALAEILGSGETLVKAGDSEALASSIISLVNDRERRLVIGKRNKERAHQYFSVEKMINEYEELYALHAGKKHNVLL